MHTPPLLLTNAMCKSNKKQKQAEFPERMFSKQQNHCEMIAVLLHARRQVPMEDTLSDILCSQPTNRHGTLSLGFEVLNPNPSQPPLLSLPSGGLVLECRPNPHGLAKFEYKRPSSPPLPSSSAQHWLATTQTSFKVSLPTPPPPWTSTPMDTHRPHQHRQHQLHRQPSATSTTSAACWDPSTTVDDQLFGHRQHRHQQHRQPVGTHQ
jgi:hypothetical protein